MMTVVGLALAVWRRWWRWWRWRQGVRWRWWWWWWWRRRRWWRRWRGGGPVRLSVCVCECKHMTRSKATCTSSHINHSRQHAHQAQADSSYLHLSHQPLDLLQQATYVCHINHSTYCSKITSTTQPFNLLQQGHKQTHQATSINHCSRLATRCCSYNLASMKQCGPEAYTRHKQMQRLRLEWLFGPSRP